MGSLVTGDYTVRGLEHVIAIERKSLDDLLTCIGLERIRFEKEVKRLLSYPIRAIAVESTWQVLESGGWRSRVSPKAAVGSCLAWVSDGVPILMCGDHKRCGRFVSRLLFTGARRRWRENRILVQDVLEEKHE